MSERQTSVVKATRAIGGAAGILLAFAVGFALAFLPLALGLHAHAEWIIVSASFLVTLVGLIVIIYGLLQLVRARAEDERSPLSERRYS